MLGPRLLFWARAAGCRRRWSACRLYKVGSRGIRQSLGRVVCSISNLEKCSVSPLLNMRAKKENTKGTANTFLPFVEDWRPRVINTGLFGVGEGLNNAIYDTAVRNELVVVGLEEVRT